MRFETDFGQQLQFDWKGFESLYQSKYGNSVDFKLKMEEILKEFMNDEYNIMENLEELFLEELNYWNFAYYKLGIIDGINISQEIKQELKNWKK